MIQLEAQTLFQRPAVAPGDPVAVVRVRPFQQGLPARRYRPRREPQDPIGLVRPLHLAARQLDLPASHVGDLLGLGELSPSRAKSVLRPLRKLRMGGPTTQELGLPDVVRDLADGVRGLILVTGPTGSGKTTTLASMIQHINSTREIHIVTIEDPIEVLHADELASINQREVGQDSRSFLSALRAALREDPDVILIGEMRDPETVRAALQAAETGHLVLSTLHTVDATETVNRILDFFPADQQKQIRLSLAGALRAIVCQRLVRGIMRDRVACLEVCINTGRIAERVVNPELTAEIEEVVAKSGHYGMRTFDQSLLELVTLGEVAVDEAMAAATEPHDLELALQQAGLIEVGARTAG